MKKVFRGFCVLLFAGILTLGAVYGFPAPNKNNNENNQPEMLFSDYNTDDIVILGEYKNLTVDVTYTPITDESVIEYINEVLAYYPGYEEIDDTVVDNGDIVDIGYVGKWNGEVFDETESYALKIGSKTFIDGFEEGLVGAKVGDVVTLNLTFPADYKDQYGNISELAGQSTEFTVTINAIVKEVTFTYENVTDGYCYINYGFDTKQELFDYVKKMMESDLESEKESLSRNAVLEGVVDRSTVNTPMEFVHYKTTEYVNDMKADVEAAGYDFAEYLEQYYKHSEEEYYDEIFSYMKENVDDQFVLAAIAKAEGIVLDEEGYAEYVAAFVKYYGYASEEELYADYPEDEMKMAYLCNDVIDYLLEITTINYIEETETEGEPQ